MGLAFGVWFEENRNRLVSLEQSSIRSVCAEVWNAVATHSDRRIKELEGKLAEAEAKAAEAEAKIATLI